MTHAGLLYHGLSTWDATERYAMYVLTQNLCNLLDEFLY